MKKIYTIITIKKSNTTSWLTSFFITALLVILISFTNGLSAQTLNIEKVSVSGCYYTAGTSKCVVTVQVGWTGLFPGNNITVNLGSNSKIIAAESTPAYTKLLSPQVVSFEIPSDGLPGTISASVLSLVANANYTAQSACIPLSCNPGDLGGQVFFDYNNDGIHQVSETQGQSGITVTITDKNGGVYTATTDAMGLWKINIPTANYGVRVEYSNIPSGLRSSSTIAGGTTVQFYNSSSCSADLGVLNFADYSQNDPDVYIPIWYNGDPTDASLSSRFGLSKFSYTANSPNSNLPGGINSDISPAVAPYSQIGPTWGLAWNKFSKKLYAGATLRRHCGLGPQGLAGLYTYDPIVNTVSGVDLTTLGLNFGTIGSNASRGTGSVPNPSWDIEAFAKIGKVGIGGVSINGDGTELFVMNLYEKKIHVLNLPTLTLNRTINVPNPGCSGGDYRPWSVKYYKGNLYVGVVCDGESSQNKSNMNATIYEINATTGAATSILDFPLTYPKGYPNSGSQYITGWYPWTDDYNVQLAVNGYGTYIQYPTPILSDIDFDIDGAMVLNFTDRFASQWGWSNYAPDPSFSNPNTYVAFSGGDVLRAFKSNGVFALENGGVSGPLTGAFTNNNEGPGFGEFFNDNLQGIAGAGHTEMGSGGIAIKPGAGEVFAGMMDPGDRVCSGGVKVMSTQNGAYTRAINTYGNGCATLVTETFGKSNGLGDIEFAADLPNYSQIGDRVWLDSNGNGIQDPNESGVSDVTITLYDASCTVVGSTVTNGTGNYTFGNGVSGINLIPGATYYVVVGMGQFSANALTVGGNYIGTLTQANLGEGPNPTNNDNNGTIAPTSGATSCFAGLPYATVIAPLLNTVDHTIDFGFYPCSKPIAGADQAVCGGSCINVTGSSTSPSKPTTEGTWSALSSNPSGASVGATNNGIADICFTNSSNGVYSFIYTVPGGCTDTLDITVSAKPDAGANTSICGGNCMNLSGTATIGTWSSLPSNPTGSTLGATNAGIATVCFQNSANGTYSFIYTIGACSDTIDIVASPKPNADADQTACRNTIKTLTGTLPNTGTWNAMSGNPGGASLGATTAGVASVAFDGTSGGTYFFIYNTGTCEDTMSIEVGLPPTADAGSIQNLDCITTSAMIGTTSIAGNTYSWSPSAGLNANNIAQPIASPSTTTIYTVTVTGANGCDATSTVLVNVNTTIPTSDAGSTQNLDCNTTSAMIGTTSISGNTYTWSPSAGLSATNIAQPIANPTVTTTYTITVTNSVGCSATSTVVVNVNTTPPTADAGSTQNLDCTTTSAMIGTTSIAGNTYSWNPSTGLSATNIAQPTATPTVTTTYTVTVTGANGCQSTSTVEVDVNTTLPTADAGNSLNLDCVTTSGLIGTTAVAGNTYSWSPSAGLNNTLIAQPTASPNATTVYTITVTSANGCSATSIVTVNVNGNIGSIGNYVWLDLNNNGINDEPTSAGINGVSVELWNATTNSLVGTTTTGNDGSNNPGYYLFSTCISDNYFVKFPTSTGGNKLTTQTTTTATDNNSDASPVDGTSPIVAINVNGVGIAKDNTTIDAGYFKQACLGNYVWNDVNQDGLQNNGEVGVSGVTTTLYNATTNTILATVKTDAYGFYQFCGLNPGDYKVGFSLPTNYTFTGANLGSDNTIDSDPSAITGLTSTITLQSGDSNMTVDAGIYLPQPTTASVGDRVWYDVNSNGVQDPTERGVSGITISLYNCSNPTLAVATTISDANGNYKFEHVTPGSYSVMFSAPIGTIFTTSTGSISTIDNSDVDASGKTACFTVNAGDQITYVDAGIIPQTAGKASLGDKVWNDANQNGIQDATETGVAGVTVTLYDATGTTAITTTVTDGLGNYGFNNLAPACYKVMFSAIPSGYTFTTQNAGADTTKNSDADVSTGMTNTICLTVGQNNPTIDAGIYNAANTNSVGDRVWYDANKNGLQDASEYGFTGVLVTLYDCGTNAIIATTTTNANGNYLFDGIANGDYYVGFGFISGYQFTSQNADVAGIAGANNSDANPSNGFTNCVTLIGDTHITTVDAGIYPGNTRTATSSLGDIVWTDANNNGLQDDGETGVPGVTATLYQADGTTVLATTVTDGLGNYIFTNLQGGNYVVGFSNLPSGYTFTTQSGILEDELNSDANISTGKTSIIPLGLGEDKMTVDAGIVAPVNTVCLGDYVWIDLNNNGTQDANEPAVPGVTVKLYDNNTNTVLQVATTNADGNYLFCGLTNGGTYSVGFENLPTGFTFTTSTGILSTPDNSDANPTTGRTATVTLGATNDLTLDAGIYSSTTAVVGNYVWYDEDADGIQDANELPIPGVLVTMYDNTNTAVASAITDAKGGYLFTNVTPGTYTIGFTGYPTTLVPTTKGVNANADDDSNIDPTTGKTDAFTVTPGSSNLTLDAGYKANPIAGLGNYVWLDANLDGLQDANEPSISGVVVTLYDATGITPLATAITDGNGAYSFPNLTAGDYVVGFSNIPTGFTRTQSIGTLNDALNSDVNADNKTTIITLLAGTYNPNIDAGYYYGIPLPIVLQEFLVTENGCNVNLNWTTSSEKNTSYFSILRKELKEVTFNEIARVAASGTSNTKKQYRYVDANVETGKYDYKLAIHDIDNQMSYCQTKSAKVNCIEENTITVYPNPTTDQLYIAIHSEENDTYEIEVMDMSGRILEKTTSELTTKSKTIVMNLHSYANGLYQVNVKNSTEKKVFKIRKSN